MTVRQCKPNIAEYWFDKGLISVYFSSSETFISEINDYTLNRVQMCWDFLENRNDEEMFTLDFSKVLVHLFRSNLQTQSQQ